MTWIELHIWWMNLENMYIKIMPQVKVHGITRTRRGKQIRKVYTKHRGARCSSMVSAFAHGVMGRQVDPSWGEPIELFFTPASAARLV